MEESNYEQKLNKWLGCTMPWRTYYPNLLGMRRKTKCCQNIKMLASIFVNLPLATVEARTMQALDVIKEDDYEGL